MRLLRIEQEGDANAYDVNFAAADAMVRSPQVVDGRRRFDQLF